MTVSTPHYLLFSESKPQPGGPTPRDRGGRWHFVLESIDGSTQFSAADEEGEAARDRLDLLAVIRGLEALDQPSRVTLVTPSHYITRGIRFGLDQWRENDWRWESFGEMAPVPNSDLWQRVDRAVGIHDVRCRAWQLQHMSEVDDAGSEKSTDWQSAGNQLESNQHAQKTPKPSSVFARAAGPWIELVSLVIAWLRRPWTVSGARTLASCS